jgi:hypothetical protein
MAHEIAKSLLEHAETFPGRTEAIESALSLGMPLHDIETYLDWLDAVQENRQPTELPNHQPPQKSEGVKGT